MKPPLHPVYSSLHCFLGVTDIPHLSAGLVRPAWDTQSDILPIVVFTVYRHSLREEIVFVVCPWLPDTVLCHRQCPPTHVTGRETVVRRASQMCAEYQELEPGRSSLGEYTRRQLKGATLIT